MSRLKLALCLLFLIPLLGACRTIHVHRKDPPGKAYGHRKHKHVHRHGCGHWYHGGRWQDVPRPSAKS